jgi:hypothetical protein
MDSATSLGAPGLWAEYGGLIGLVICALFVITLFDKIMVQRMNNKLMDFIIKTSYQRGWIDDRRHHDVDVKIDRRNRNGPS